MEGNIEKCECNEFKKRMKYKNVVWDWNGTLLNDLEVGLSTLNRMLEKRGLERLTTEAYKSEFGFPVIDFYKKVGFDVEGESFHDLSIDFVETYALFADNVTLNEEVETVLSALQKKGIRQYVLSALREDLLQQMLRDFSIASYFEKACGSDDIYAAGKVERGRRMVEQLGIDPQVTLMIGDTIHDAEVAEALGFDCVLFSGGHNSVCRLKKKGKVIHRLEDLLHIPCFENVKLVLE